MEEKLQANMTRDEHQNIEAFYKAIGYNIQKQRQSAGMTLPEIETGIRVSAENLSRYEKGDLPVPVIDLVKIAQFLNIPPASLLEGLPSLAAPITKQTMHGFAEAHIEEFQQNFLKVTGPGRGKKFKKFVQSISDDDDDNGGTKH